MPLLPITALYGSLLGFLLLHLAYIVIVCRQAHKSGLGHTNNELLIVGRNHANATEYIPITLILFALAELNGAANSLLHVIGGVFVAARLFHAWGFKISKGKAHMGRYWGTFITFLCIILLAFINLYLSWPYL